MRKRHLVALICLVLALILYVEGPRLAIALVLVAVIFELVGWGLLLVRGRSGRAKGD